MISDRVVKHHMNCGSSFYAFVFKILSENQYQISKWIIDGVNFSPPSRFQRDFLDTSVTFKSHEHLTWPYPPPFSAFVSIMNFLINNNRKNLAFLLVYIIPTSVLSIYICGFSAGTIRAVPDTELKVPGLAPVLIFHIFWTFYAISGNWCVVWSCFFTSIKNYDCTTF